MQLSVQLGVSGRRDDVGVLLARARWFLLVLGLTSIAQPSPTLAALDVEDQGPTVTVGGFSMRVTNAGILGNAFFDVGRSFDPSFEFPSHSGNECLNYGALWVGARLPSGRVRVSGGPILEWRPTLAEDDRVRIAATGHLGTTRLVDDDGDREIDEEWLDGRDDDGDLRVDEDLGLDADQVAFATFSDFEQAATTGSYPGGEAHEPLGLVVRQTAMAWTNPSLRGIAGIRFEITNVGDQPLYDVYVGVYSDLDSRRRSDVAGHLNDRLVRGTEQVVIPTGRSGVTAGGRATILDCQDELAADYVAVLDGVLGTNLPAVAVVPLAHTLDPLAWIPAGQAYATTPRELQFSTTVFLPAGSASRGFVPIFDTDRYSALRGEYPDAPADVRGDFSTLVSCGPFSPLQPGRAIQFAVAIVAASAADSIPTAVRRVLSLYNGITVNLLPDSIPVSERDQFRSGATGTFGHEVCVEPPPGVTFTADPHCTSYFSSAEGAPLSEPALYAPGSCVWTNADCDLCTGMNGNETRLHWFDGIIAAPSPGQTTTPGDHQVQIAWDNLPEVLSAAGQLGPWPNHVVGYRVWKLADWRRRSAALPPRENWALMAAFAFGSGDTLFGEQNMLAATDSSLDYREILYERKWYPVGRYRITDREVHNGFDYVYRVTTVSELEVIMAGERAGRENGNTPGRNVTDVVVPHAGASSIAGAVWVVPNPYRGHADWDRPPVAGNPIGQHVDFMGLPQARATIKIWTVSGDFVAQVDHDGTAGDGQAAWNLVSRNGQDVVSGIYLFTVTSALGSQAGRFVIIR